MMSKPPPPCESGVGSGKSGIRWPRMQRAYACSCARIPEADGLPVDDCAVVAARLVVVSFATAGDAGPPPPQPAASMASPATGAAEAACRTTAPRPRGRALVREPRARRGSVVEPEDVREALQE